MWDFIKDMAWAFSQIFAVIIVVSLLGIGFIALLEILLLVFFKCILGN